MKDLIVCPSVRTSDRYDPSVILDFKLRREGGGGKRGEGKNEIDKQGEIERIEGEKEVGGWTFGLIASIDTSKVVAMLIVSICSYLSVSISVCDAPL